MLRKHSSEWACAPLIVPKDGPEKFRFTVDLRPVITGLFEQSDNSAHLAHAGSRFDNLRIGRRLLLFHHRSMSWLLADAVGLRIARMPKFHYARRRLHTYASNAWTDKRNFLLSEYSGEPMSIVAGEHSPMAGRPFPSLQKLQRPAGHPLSPFRNL